MVNLRNNTLVQTQFPHSVGEIFLKTMFLMSFSSVLDGFISIEIISQYIIIEDLTDQLSNFWRAVAGLAE